MLKLSELLHGYFLRWDNGHWQFRNRYGKIFTSILKISDNGYENVVLFNCPLCESNQIMLIFNKDRVYNCEYNEIEPNHVCICKACGKLDLSNLDSLWTQSQIPDSLLQRIKKNLQLLGEI